jgi:ABC-type phosphate transport system substrate-binding protein
LRSHLGRFVALAAAAAAASLGIMTVPAHAGPTTLTGTANSLAEVGSDTSYFMMSGIAPQYNVDTTHNTDAACPIAPAPCDYVTEVPPINNAPFPAGTFVPKDAVVGGPYTWNSSTTSGGACGAGTTPPNGSSAGISCLVADTTGQVDFSRSSRGSKAGDPANLQFWAYALGALDYVTFPGTHAPTNLTQTQLIDIYTCNASGPNVGKPIISDWHTINPSAPVGSTIVKYMAQTSSGTYSFFNSKLLNGATVDANCVGAANMSHFHEEHDSRSVTAASKPNAIDAFDWSKWNAQADGYEADLRNGATLGSLNSVVPSQTTVNTTASRFLGTRYIYNVMRTDNHPAGYTAQTVDLLKFIGVRSSTASPAPGPGFICSNAMMTVIKLAGFKPLASGPTGGTGLPNSFCRLNPVGL